MTASLVTASLFLLPFLAPAGFAGEPPDATPPEAFGQWLTNVAVVTRPQYVVQPFSGKVVVLQRGSLAEVDVASDGTLLSPNDRVRSREGARARLLNAYLVGGVAPLTDIKVIPPDQQPTLHIDRGRLYYKAVGPALEARVRATTPDGVVRLHGTEFQIEVDPALKRTLVTMFEGTATLGGTNGLDPQFEPIEIHAGKVGEVFRGEKPRPPREPSEPLTDTIQWILHYPPVLDPDELPAETRFAPALLASINHYRDGDPIAAFEALPATETNTPGERVYRAALHLHMGQIPEAEGLLATVGEDPPFGNNSVPISRLVEALRQSVAAVKLRPRSPASPPASATEWLAESYRIQSQIAALGSLFSPTTTNNTLTSPPSGPNEHRLTETRDDLLRKALGAAETATKTNASFVYAWVRVAELRFGMGNVDGASNALTSAGIRTERNAEAMALRGFLAAAAHDAPTAERAFLRSVHTDGTLGMGWLGLGLIHIRAGDHDSGLRFLQLATLHEPQRAFLRSYLGKGYYDTATTTAHPLETLKRLGAPRPDRDDLVRRATNELFVAKSLDVHDPTPHLFSALVNFQENRNNAAIRDLERSIDLNENRAVYRSGLLLGQDHAMRSANLAAIYRDTDLLELGFNEAARAVDYDYANYSAHLFLANTYDTLRDRRRVDLRYETPWINELLVANLLSPVSAGSLAQTVSQQEYSRLFDRATHSALFTSSEYRSSGDWLASASAFGNVERLGYSLDGSLGVLNGDWPNAEIEEREILLKLKYATSPTDSLFFQVSTATAEGGDAAQRLSVDDWDPDRHIVERQEPYLLAGYHREWATGQHTLALAGWLRDTLSAEDSMESTPINDTAWSTSPPLRLRSLLFDSRYENEINVVFGEVQHVIQGIRNTLLVGGRIQGGRVERERRIQNAQVEFALPQPVPFGDPGFPPPPGNPTDSTSLSDPSDETNLERYSVYAYDHFRIVDSLLLTGGLTFDSIRVPSNFGNPPLSTAVTEKDQLSPKAGITWAAGRRTNLRASFAQSLTGLTFDNDFRLEPSQIAGQPFSFRSLFPPAYVGTVSGERITTWGASADHRFGANTYLTISGSAATSGVGLPTSAFQGDLFDPSQVSRVPVSQDLDYREETAWISLHHLLQEDWVLGARYRIQHAAINGRWHALPADDERNVSEEAVLHSISLSVRYQHRRGFFAIAEGEGLFQRDYEDHIPKIGGVREDREDSAWQFHLHGGYRFPQRRVEIRVGVLNLFDESPRLDPLNMHADRPQERTFVIRFVANL